MPGRKTKIKPGDKFGCWTVLRRGEDKGRFKKQTHVCECRCGNVREVLNNNLYRGENKACNKCRTQLFTVDGVGTGTVRQLSIKAGIRYSTVWRRISKGQSVEDAILAPQAQHKKLTASDIMSDVFSGLFTGECDEPMFEVWE